MPRDSKKPPRQRGKTNERAPKPRATPAKPRPEAPGHLAARAAWFQRRRRGEAAEAAPPAPTDDAARDDADASDDDDER